MKKTILSKFAEKTRITKGGSGGQHVRPGRFSALAVALLVAAAGVLTLLFSRAATTTPTLYISPASQTIAAGSDITFSVVIDTASASVNTVQTVVTYDASKFSFVSMTAGSAFGAAFPNSTSSGSIQFTAGSTTAVTGTQTVATITLHALADGSAPIQLASVCAAGDYSATCSAAYDSVTSDNVLDAVAGANYTVGSGNTPSPTPPPSSPGTVSLSISPASQTVNEGDNAVFTVVIDTGGASVNTAQTVVTYPADKFSYVSAAAGSAFGAAFPVSTATGSITFTAGATTAVTGTQTVATITLHALADGSAPIQLASVCAAGDYSATCSAAYDSVTSDNILTTIAGASYTITAGGRNSTPPPSPTPSPSPSPSPSPTPTPTTSTNKSTSTKTTTYSGTTSNTKTSPSPSPDSAANSTPSSSTPVANAEDASTATAPKTIDVTLKILDNKKQPIKGAKVTIAGKSGTTASSGSVTIYDVSVGKQKVVITVGGKQTTSSIRVGEIDPDTGVYAQNFTLTAQRGSSATPYIVIGLTILLIGAALLMVPNGLVSKLTAKPKGPGKPGAGGGVVGGNTDRPTGSDLPTKIITPNSSSNP